MRRLLAAGVQVRAPFTQRERELAALVGTSLQVSQPTEVEVRDAFPRLAAELREMVTARTAGAAGWNVGDMATSIVTTAEGEIILRGQVIIERADA